MLLRKQTGKYNVGEFMYCKKLASKREANLELFKAKTNMKCPEDSSFNLLHRHHYSQSLAKLLLLNASVLSAVSLTEPRFSYISLLRADSSTCLDVSLTLTGFLVRPVHNTIISVAWKGSNKIKISTFQQ